MKTFLAWLERSSAIAVAILIVAGCNVGPRYNRPTVSTPPAFRGADDASIVRDAQNLLLDEAPMPFLYSQVYYPTSYSYVKGWRMTPGFNQGWMLPGVWLDKP